MQLIQIQRASNWLRTHHNFSEFSIPRAKIPLLLKDFSIPLNQVHDHLGLPTDKARRLCESVAQNLSSSRETVRYFSLLLLFLGLISSFFEIPSVLDKITEYASSHTIHSPTLFLSKNINSILTPFTVGILGFIFLSFLDIFMNKVRRHFISQLHSWLDKLSSTFSPSSKLDQAQESHGTLYPAAVFTSMAHSLETINSNLAKQVEYQKSLQQNIQDLTDKLKSLTDQVRTEQILMIKLAEGQIALQSNLDKFNEAALSGDLGFDKISKNHLRSMSRATSQIVDSLISGNITKDIKQELRIITKALSINQDPKTSTRPSKSIKVNQKSPSI